MAVIFRRVIHSLCIALLHYIGLQHFTSIFIHLHPFAFTLHQFTSTCIRFRACCNWYTSICIDLVQIWSIIYFTFLRAFLWKLSLGKIVQLQAIWAYSNMNEFTTCLDYYWLYIFVYIVSGKNCRTSSFFKYEWTQTKLRLQTIYDRDEYNHLRWCSGNYSERKSFL